MKRCFSVFLIFAMILCFSLTAFASTGIPTIRVKIQVEGEGENPELTALSGSNKYQVVSTELYGGFYSPATGPGVEIGADEDPHQIEVPECEIDLYAAEDYHFDVMGQQDIKISGIEGQCTKAVRRDNGKNLLLTVRLTGLLQYVGQIPELHFKDGLAGWEPAVNAATYSLVLYRNNRKRGQPHETSGTSFDFSPLLTEPGRYSYRIAPSPAGGERGRYAESVSLEITSQQAEQNRLLYPWLKTAWQQDEKGWRYWREDGIYLQNNWIQEQTDWYFFDEDGYLVTDARVLWKGQWHYFSEDGSHFLNTSRNTGISIR